ncbi:MAG: helix-turn-helix domain-containing protein [Actinomycetota bacterium]|nr:helix-turn-helix domain-containing protein [Actinomycetota bacterium]
MTEEGDFYTPQEAARLLARTDKPISESRIRQLLQTEELKGVRDDWGRWYVEQHEVHRLMEQRREADSQELREPPKSAGELFEIVRALERVMGGFEGRLELTERAESTVREERDRLLRELEEVRAERRQLQTELEEARRPWWRRLFGG